MSPFIYGLQMACGVTLGVLGVMVIFLSIAMMIQFIAERR